MTGNENDGGGLAADPDVVIVGGGPAGCSAGVFLARYGLDAVIFDRGPASLRRCAYLENYLGFPAGIDIGTMYDLMHDHASDAGCEVVSDTVDAVARSGDGEFVVRTQDDRTVTTERVVAAARYDASYLRSLGSDEMFAVHEHEGERREHFDRDYPNPDGTTPIDGLYVASPAGEAEAQAIISAGRGARVARTILADVRRERGFPESIAPLWDWRRKEATLTGEWADRDRWDAWFDEQVDGDDDAAEGQLLELREQEIDRRVSTYVSESEIERRTERGHKRLLEHIDDEYILEAAREIEGRAKAPDGSGGQ